LRKAPDLQIHPVGDVYVVHQTRTNEVHHLNATAALLFELCNGHVNDDEIVALAAAAFALGPSDAESLRGALATLLRSGVLMQDVTDSAPATTAGPAVHVSTVKPRAPKSARRKKAATPKARVVAKAKTKKGVVASKKKSAKRRR
jgi:hypothetical protein